jgi:hypothetical protein
MDIRTFNESLDKLKRNSILLRNTQSGTLKVIDDKK